MGKHWSERLGCQCGASFRAMAAEAYHRHNFPLLCRPPKKPKPAVTSKDKVEAKP